jgi:hypothetical protein
MTFTSTPWKPTDLVLLWLHMPPTRDIQRRVERLEQTNAFQSNRFAFDVRMLAALLGKDWVKPCANPASENPTHGEHVIPAPQR